MRQAPLAVAFRGTCGDLRCDLMSNGDASASLPMRRTLAALIGGAAKASAS